MRNMQWDNHNSFPSVVGSLLSFGAWALIVGHEKKEQFQKEEEPFKNLEPKAQTIICAFLLLFSLACIGVSIPLFIYAFS